MTEKTQGIPTNANEPGTKPEGSASTKSVAPGPTGGTEPTQAVSAGSTGGTGGTGPSDPSKGATGLMSPAAADAAVRAGQDKFMKDKVDEAHADGSNRERIEETSAKPEEGADETTFVHPAEQLKNFRG